MASEWRDWGVLQWNRQLVDHFFGRRFGDDEVVSLLVTADELAKVTGDPSAEAEEVRDVFVSTVLAQVQSSERARTLFRSLELGDWTPARVDQVPPFVSHLFFTCIAASQSDDEIADEGSFVRRLHDLAGGALTESELGIMPRWWEALAEWLAAGSNSLHYRSLRLPDPGGLTRIGYTVKLAFPDRRDQRELSLLLSSNELDDQEPPVGRVVSLVGRNRSRFRPRFLEVFDDFRQQYRRRGARAVASHKFWAAVRDAALRGRGVEDRRAPWPRVQLLAVEQEDTSAIFVAADGEITDAESPVSTLPLPMPYGEWRLGVVDAAATRLSPDDLDRVTRFVLDGSIRLPKLGVLADQGVLLFAVGLHGLLELASRDDYEAVQVALVRTTLVSDFVRLFGSGRARQSPSRYEGWVEVRGARPQELGPSEIAGTPFESCACLQEAVVPVRVRLTGGVRIGDGWLGLEGALPLVVADGATRIVATDPGGREFDLERTEDGSAWRFPERDFVGDFRVRALAKDEVLTRAQLVRFLDSPTQEEYRPPSDLGAWFREGSVGSLSSDVEPWLSSSPDATDFADWMSEPVFLGPGIGEFVDAADRATWVVRRVAGTALVTLGARREGVTPEYVSEDAALRRRWRQLLFTKSEPDPADSEVRGARTAMSWARSDCPRVRQLSRVALPDSADLVGADREPRPARTHPGVERIVKSLASLAVNRAGVRWHEWAGLAKQALDIDEAAMSHVTRAWIEAGCFDDFAFARWRARMLFMRPPVLVCYRVGGGFGATLCGLALPRTLDELRDAARQQRRVVEERPSLSPYVPGTVAVWVPSSEDLVRIAAAADVPVRWLRPTWRIEGGLRHVENGSDPPSNYERTFPVRGWAGREIDPRVEVVRAVRGDSPDYWRVSDGVSVRWSYARNAAFLWRAALADEQALESTSCRSLIARTAYLPLAVARAMSILAHVRPGPADEPPRSDYIYPFPSRPLKDAVSDFLTKTFGRAADPNQE